MSVVVIVIVHDGLSILEASLDFLETFLEFLEMPPQMGFALHSGGGRRILHERVVFGPIWENGFIRGVGPRVEEPGRYEDIRLKRDESSRLPRLHHP